MRRLLPAACLATVLLLAGCGSNTSGQAATVNGVSVPVSRLTQMLKAQLAQQQSQQQQQGQQQQQLPDIDGLTRQSLEGLIQVELILDGARKAGITVDESDVDARIQQVKAQAQAQGMKYEDLLQQNSLTEDLLRQQFRAEVALDQLGSKLVPYPPDSQLIKLLGQHKADFEQIHVRHVLVKDEATARKVRSQLAGGDWAKVARQFSIDPQSKNRGGDISYVSKGQTVAQFERAAFALANQGSCKGKTSGACASPISVPVHSQFGFHVIQVIGLRLPALTNDLRNQLEPTIKERRDSALQAWFADQVKRANVTVNPRFGRWDASTGKVVERTTAPGSPTQSSQAQPPPGQP